MYFPDVDTLEAAQVLHSFIERLALGFFAGVVLCDVILQMTDDSAGLIWTVGWHARKRYFTLYGRSFAITWPSYNGSISLRSLLKVNSLLWFGLAIGLEILALPYGERIDELAAKELSRSDAQTVAALSKAGIANREANLARKEASESPERSKKIKRANLVLQSNTAQARATKPCRRKNPRV